MIAIQACAAGTSRSYKLWVVSTPAGASEKSTNNITAFLAASTAFGSPTLGLTPPPLKAPKPLLVL